MSERKVDDKRAAGVARSLPDWRERYTPHEVAGCLAIFASDLLDDREADKQEIARLTAVLRKVARGLSVPGAHPDFMEEDDIREAVSEWL